MPNPDLPAGQLTPNMHLPEELVQCEEKPVQTAFRDRKTLQLDHAD